MTKIIILDQSDDKFYKETKQTIKQDHHNYPTLLSANSDDLSKHSYNNDVGVSFEGTPISKENRKMKKPKKKTQSTFFIFLESVAIPCCFFFGCVLLFFIFGFIQ